MFQSAISLRETPWFIHVGHLLCNIAPINIAITCYINKARAVYIAWFLIGSRSYYKLLTVSMNTGCTYYGSMRPKLNCFHIQDV